MEGYTYFPAVVYRDERPDFLSTILPVCKKYLDAAGYNHSYKRVVQSQELRTEPALREVMDYLLHSAVSLLIGQGYVVDKYDFYISSLWAQEIYKGAGVDTHVHSNSQINGWLFVETPQNGSYPIYHDSRLNKPMVDLDMEEGSEVKIATSFIHFDNVKPGTVLFSNSWLRHQLAHSNSDEPTTCLHFVISHREKL